MLNVSILYLVLCFISILDLWLLSELVSGICMYLLFCSYACGMFTLASVSVSLLVERDVDFPE